MNASLSRRAVLAGGGALAIAGAIGFGGRNRPAPLPAGLIAPGMDALLLHQGGIAAHALLRQARAAAATVSAHKVAPLSRQGFADMTEILQRRSGVVLVALLGDAEAVILETLLVQAQVHGIAHRRHAGQALLTAHL